MIATRACHVMCHSGPARGSPASSEPSRPPQEACSVTLHSTMQTQNVPRNSAIKNRQKARQKREDTELGDPPPIFCPSELGPTHEFPAVGIHQRDQRPSALSLSICLLRKTPPVSLHSRSTCTNPVLDPPGAKSEGVFGRPAVG